MFEGGQSYLQGKLCQNLDDSNVGHTNFIFCFSDMGGEGNKGTRRVTNMAGLTKLSHQNHLEIEFNECGSAIRPNISQFVSYIGMMIQTIMCVF